MSKVARMVGQIASIVAVAASIALLFVPGGQIFGVALMTIAAAAGAVSAVAMTIAQATAKPPDMKGTVSQVVIGNNLPILYAMGHCLIGGMQVYDKSANGAANFDRTQIMVGTAAGPIEGFQQFQGDYSNIGFSGADWNVSRVATGFYGADDGYLWLNTRKGLRPETALTAFAGRDAFDEWGSDYKLSGYAAWAVTMEWDEDGKRWASGIPQWGMIAKWVKNYDPRKDTTYPGGSGSQRFNDESTFAYGTDGVGTIAQGENPALHALTYARGRFIEKDAGGTPLAEPVKICGIGLPYDSIRVEDFVELANLCDTNGWKIAGAVYEGPGANKWDNLKRILQAGGAEPVWSGGTLSLKINSPKTSVATIGRDDLASGDMEFRAMQGWRDRINTVVARVRLSTHKWEYEQLEAVSSATYVTEDGETKTREVQFDLVGGTDAVATADHGAELAAYELVNSREYGPVQLPLKPAFMMFRPGEAVDLDLASLLDDPALGTQQFIILGRQIDPATGAVMMSFESETTAKHAFALGQTGVAPPTPTIVPPEDLDEGVSGSTETPVDAATITLVEWNDRLVMRTDLIPRATSYRWRFYLSDGTTLKREITTAGPQVEYTKAQAHADGVSRDYKIEVAGVNSNGTGTALMSATQTKTAPGAPTSVAFADGTSTSAVTFTPPGGSPAGYRIAWSTTTGFDPMTEGASMNAGVSPAYTPQLPAASYFGKVASYDLWSQQPDQINFSAQDAFTITPGTGGSPPAGGGGGGFGGGGGGSGHVV